MSAETFPVEASHIMMFARAVGDANPVYSGAERGMTTGDSILAPPTFAAASAQFAPCHPMRPEIGQPWFGSGKAPTGVPNRPQGGGNLHAEQHYEYLRHLRPGDVLSSRTREGETWQKQSRRGGLLTFRERITEYFDQENTLVLVARSVTVQPERAVTRA
jgi:hypothetical protein